MIDGRTVLAFIPARGGSKGLRRKNLLPLKGKPLMAWSIEAAQASAYVDCIALSSEDEEIIETARQWGCHVPFSRPIELAKDTTRTIEVLHHLLRNTDTKYDLVVQLQPTSPLRTAADIDGALKYWLQSGAPACVSVSPVDKSPHCTFARSADGVLTPLLPFPRGKSRRQDLTGYFQLNGAIYCAERDWITQHDSFLSEDTIGYVMPTERSLDIDTSEDIIIAEHRLCQKKSEVGVL